MEEELNELWDLILKVDQEYHKYVKRELNDGLLLDLPDSAKLKLKLKKSKPDLDVFKQIVPKCGGEKCGGKQVFKSKTHPNK